MEKILKLNNTYSISLNWKLTKNGFKHIGKILKYGYINYEKELNYYNRTWEKFEYECILKSIIKDYFERENKEKFLNLINKLNYI